VRAVGAQRRFPSPDRSQRCPLAGGCSSSLRAVVVTVVKESCIQIFNSAISQKFHLPFFRDSGGSEPRGSASLRRRMRTALGASISTDVDRRLPLQSLNVGRPDHSIGVTAAQLLSSTADRAPPGQPAGSAKRRQSTEATGADADERALGLVN